MKTIFSAKLPTFQIVRLGKRILSVLTVLSFSFNSNGQEHNTISSLQEQEHKIQQWTEETDTHVPQLNVFTKLTSLLENISEGMVEDQQSTKKSISNSHFIPKNIPEALEKNCGGILN